jgi:cytidyltransferase-like protein
LAIRKVKLLGDYLVVHVVSDERVRAKKGKDRPIIPCDERMAMIAALRDVDEVVSLEGPEYPVYDLLEVVKPNILVVENEPDDRLKDECEVRGIRLVVLKRVVPESGLDTTGIIAKIRG